MYQYCASKATQGELGHCPVFNLYPTFMISKK